MRRKSMRSAAGALSAVLLLALSLAPISPVGPAAAVGPSISVSAGPQSVTVAPSAGASAQANFSGAVELYSNPVGAASLTVTITSHEGWTVTPAGFSWRPTEAGHFPYTFVVEVPPDAPAGLTDSIDVVASYRVGGVTVQSESVTVHAEAGSYYGASARRITAPQTMEVGKEYLIEYDLRNDGNAAATFVFSWADPAVNSKTRAKYVLPQGTTLGGFANQTIQIFVTPASTTPGGHYAIPLRIDLKDKSNQVRQSVQISIDMEFVNAPIFMGIFPNWDLSGPYALAGWAGVFLVLWLLLQVGVAFVRARSLPKEGGVRFTRALSAGIRKSLLVRGVGRVWDKVPRPRLRRARGDA